RRPNLALDLPGDGLRPLGRVRHRHLGGDGEPGRHRDTEARHLRETRTLSAQKGFLAGISVGGSRAEYVDVSAHRQPHLARDLATGIPMVSIPYVLPNWVLHWAILSLAFWITSKIVPGFRVAGLWDAVLVAAIFGIVDMLFGWLLFVIFG